MIINDSRELQTERGNKRIASIKESFKDISTERLDSGDYWIKLDELTVPVEVATYSELIQSMNSGRKHDQLARCRAMGESWLISENADHRDFQTIARIISHQRAGTMVLQSLGPHFTGKLIVLLHRHYTNQKHDSIKNRQYIDDSPDMAPQESALTAVDGIGKDHAKNIIKHAGTINNLAMYDFDELQMIPGIGEELAKRLFIFLHHEVIP